VQTLRDNINTHFGANIAVEVSEREVMITPTGILSMDLALGNGGVLGGRIIDTWGWEATGKTLLTLTIGGYIQRCMKPLKENGKVVKDKDGNIKMVPKIVAFLDAEGTFSPKFAQSAGVITDKLILVRSTPDRILSGEDYFETAIRLVQADVDYIIIDSCPALTPRQVIVNQFGFAQKASTAQLMSEGLKMITPILNSSSNSIVHFINQIRGRPMAQTWQSPTTPTGGEALKFYSSYRLEVVHSEDITKKVLTTDGSYQPLKVGVNVGIKIHKNKTASEPQTLPSKNYHFDLDIYFMEFQGDDGLVYNRGVDLVKDSIVTGVRLGVIKQKSSWFSFGEINENGMTALVGAIKSNPTIMGQIREAVFDTFKSKPTESPVEGQANV
jgi:recombination protein RecA